MAQKTSTDTNTEEMSGHVIVCGLGHVGFRVAHLLRTLGEPTTVITLASQDKWLHTIQEMGARVLLGDARDPQLLFRAGISSARALIVATDHDLVNVEITLDARRMRDDLPIVIRLFDQTLARQFEVHFDTRRAVDMSELAAPEFVAAALGSRVAGSFTVGGTPYVAGRLTLDRNSPLQGLTMEEAQAHYRLAPLMYVPVGSQDSAVPGSGVTLHEGDQLIALGAAKDWDRLGPHIPLEAERPRKRSLWRRFSDYIHLPEWGPLLRQIWQNAPFALRSALLFLFVVLGLSVVVFERAMNLTFVDAVYFMITTVTTTGYGDISPHQSSTFVKLYTTLVMMIGAATLAVIFTILTDFIVTSRFEQILGRHRFPRENHVVVVGLGNVGFRIVNELRRTGARVLAVDRNADGPFVSTVRAHTPVLIGDARVLETLEAAYVRTASAVIAVTNDDAVNLGIGLLAEQVNGDVHTVVRFFDADFAQKVEDDLSIDVAISASRISAPTFVAAALNPGVLNAFILDGRFFTVLERPVSQAWEGLTPAQLRDSLGIIVVARRSSSGIRNADAVSPLVRGEILLVVTHRILHPV